MNNKNEPDLKLNKILEFLQILTHEVLFLWNIYPSEIFR